MALDGSTFATKPKHRRKMLDIHLENGSQPAPSNIRSG
jgi:hypothetical protein